MAYAEGSHPDAAILTQIRELTANISDQRTQMILRSVIDAVALNPQPLPPDPPPETDPVAHGA